MFHSDGKHIEDLLRLDSKNAVITGGACGIGESIAERLAEAGARVTIFDKRKDRGQDTAEEIKETIGGRASYFEGDVSRKADLDACAKKVIKEEGSLDVWVNNAGIFPNVDPLEVSEEEVKKIIDINLLGAYFGIQAAAKNMNRGGVILNLASTAAYHWAGPYAVSKWAVRGMTTGFAPLLGPKGIRIVGLAPTITETPGIRNLRKETGGEALDELIKSLPLGRPATGDDVARVALFLLSDAAALITGVTVPVDAGELSL